MTMQGVRPRAGRKAPATPQERAARGRDARARVPRSSHAWWEPAPDRRDPVEILLEQADGRVAELVPIRHGRMVASQLAFYRGAAAIMAADLATTPVSGIRAQLCGDAHLSNFGGFASPERDLVFSVNDFDETLPGPWEWDVKRLAASLAVAGRDRGFTARQRNAVVTAAARQYRTTTREFAPLSNLDVWYARLDANGIMERWRGQASPKAVRAFERNLDRARSKDSMRAFAKLTREVDGAARIVSDPPLIVPIDELLSGRDQSAAERGAREIVREYRQSLPRDRRRLLDGFSYGDFARKVVGVGSVGTRAWIALLLGRDHGDPLFLQVKEAQESVLAPYAGASEFRNQGRRVVEGQRLIQATSDIFLGWYSTNGLDGVHRDYYVRQLWDWKFSALVDQMTPSTMGIYGEACAWTLARAHARSGDRIAVAAYLGSGPRFENAIAEFAEAYADQNDRDHRALVDAIETGSVAAEHGV
jgi:uncharacterized protein (DUF2252 family)